MLSADTGGGGQSKIFTRGRTRNLDFKEKPNDQKGAHTEFKFGRELLVGEQTLDVVGFTFAGTRVVRSARRRHQRHRRR